jgi:cysteine desulfurase
MAGALSLAGNPSSVHREGREARAAVEAAREQVATLVGTASRNVIFASGGSEANAMALTPFIISGKPREAFERLLVSAVEHPSVLGGGRFPPERVRTVGVLPSGQIDLDDLRAKLREGGRPLVSVMAANNESGVVQPIAEVAEAVHAADGLLHVDAVQVVGRLPTRDLMRSADLITVSAHKLGGPKGVGALIKRDQALHIAEPLIRGGGQERGSRAGTENVPGIVGFGAAAAAALEDMNVERAHTLKLRSQIEAGLRAASPHVVIFGEDAERLPNTVLFSLAGIKTETAIIAFDLDGVALSSGSACSSGKVAPSHVLAAMGVDAELARGAIRVSVGYSTSEEDVEAFLASWRKRVELLLKANRSAAA